MDDGDVLRHIATLVERNELVANVQRGLVRPCPVPRTQQLRDRTQIGRGYQLLG